MTWKVGFQPCETNIRLIPKVLKQLRGTCEFCGDRCSWFSQQATIVLLWGLQNQIRRVNEAPAAPYHISWEKKRGRTRQSNETAPEKCWFLALGLSELDSAAIKGPVLTYCVCGIRSPDQKYEEFEVTTVRVTWIHTKVYEISSFWKLTCYRHDTPIFTSVMWHIFAWNWIFMVENVGILMLSIRIDWNVIMWQSQTRMDQKRQSYQLSPNPFFRANAHS